MQNLQDQFPIASLRRRNISAWAGPGRAGPSPAQCGAEGCTCRAKPLLAWNRLLQVQQQGLGFEFRCPLQHGHQHALQNVSQGIGTAASVATPQLLLPLRLQLTPVDPLGAAQRDPHRIGRHLLAKATGLSGHVPLLDP